jgi:hypothetical protein
MESIIVVSFCSFELLGSALRTCLLCRESLRITLRDGRLDQTIDNMLFMFLDGEVMVSAMEY